MPPLIDAVTEVLASVNNVAGTLKRGLEQEGRAEVVAPVVRAGNVIGVAQLSVYWTEITPVSKTTRDTISMATRPSQVQNVISPRPVVTGKILKVVACGPSSRAASPTTSTTLRSPATVARCWVPEGTC